MGNIIATIKYEWSLSGLRIRLITRIDMTIAIILMLLYTYWLFKLPRDWEPELEQQGPLEPKQYRIFCFFVYIVALLINILQFFTGFLLFGSVQEGINDRDEVIATSEYYIALSFMLNVVLFIKFHLLLFYLDIDKLIVILMTLPEMVFHTVSVIVILMFLTVLKKSNRINSVDDDAELQDQDQENDNEGAQNSHENFGL